MANIEIGDLVKHRETGVYGLVYGFFNPAEKHHRLCGRLECAVPEDASCDIHWADGQTGWVELDKLEFVQDVSWEWKGGTPSWPDCLTDLSKMTRQCDHPFPERP